MLALLTRNWRMMLLNGACAIVFASLVLSWDSIAASGLALCFGCYCLVNGAVSIAAARGTKRRTNKLRREFLIIGLLSLCAGSLFVLSIGDNMEWLAMLASAWAMSVGVIEIWAALKVRKIAPRERLFFLIGASSILLNLTLEALVFFAVPAIPGALAVMMTIRGGLLIALGLKLLGYRLISSDLARERHSVTELIRFGAPR